MLEKLTKMSFTFSELKMSNFTFDLKKDDFSTLKTQINSLSYANTSNKKAFISDEIIKIGINGIDFTINSTPKEKIAIGEHGFHLTFSNGYTMSVQCGKYNYCGNYPENNDEENDKKPIIKENAEIAYWKIGEKMQEFEDGDTVKGYVSPDEIAEWIYKIKNK